MTDSCSTSTGVRRPQTGNPQVDKATAGLAGLDDLPVDEHAVVYDRVDSGLRAVLSTAGDTAVDDTAEAPDPQTNDESGA